MLKIKVHKTSEDAVIPSYAHSDDAGMDLFSVQDYLLEAGHRCLVKTGLKMEIPVGYEAQIRPKSGLALRDGITVLNTPGTIDAGYRGEIGVIAINHSSKAYKIEKGQKIAQMVFNKIEKAKFQISSLSMTKRGEGGFGSTGL